MGYVKKSVKYVQVGWIGDAKRDLRLHLYTDADFAGCSTTNRYTSGVFLAIEGPNSSFPIGHSSKKQYVTSTSTTEAEICAAAYALRQVGLPGSIIWDVIMGFIDVSGVNEIELASMKADFVAGRKVGASSPGLTAPRTDVDNKGFTGRMLTPHEIFLGKRTTPKVAPDAANQCEQVLHMHCDNTA